MIGCNVEEKQQTAQNGMNKTLLIIAALLC
jgi:hypothetical protein